MNAPPHLIKLSHAFDAGLPTNFLVQFGAYQSGTLEDLHDSDDQRLVVEQRPAFSPLLRGTLARIMLS